LTTGATSSRLSFANLFSKGIWAVLDQGVFAISNFIVNILLARWLSLQDYGSFAASFSVLLLIGTFHTALITEPLLVYGSNRFKHRITDYAASLIFGHAIFSILTSVMILCAIALLTTLGQKQYVQAAIGLLIAQPFILLTWLTRRLCYCHFTVQLAVMAGVINLCVTLSGCYLLFSIGKLSPLTAFVLMGICGLLSSCLILFRLFSSSEIFNSSAYNREFLSAHLHYGRWALPSSLLTWIPANFYFVILPFWGHIELVALLKAQNNLLTPVLQFNTALATQLIPVFAKCKDRLQQAKWSRYLLASFTMISLLYWFMLFVFGDFLMQALYGPHFLRDNKSLLILGLLPLLTGVIAVLGSSIRANDKPHQIFWSYLSASFFSTTIGVWMMIRWELIGTSIAIVTSYLVVTTVMSCYYVFDRSPHIHAIN